MNLSRSEYYLGIDQGSQSTKAVFYNGQDLPIIVGNIKIGIKRKFKNDLCYAEQDPQEILDSVVKLINKAKNLAKRKKVKICGLGLACQRSGVLAWQSDRILHPLISWQDTRFQNQISKISKKDKSYITKVTGLPVIANYAAAKISYLQKKFPKENQIIGTLDSFLIDQLTQHQLLCTEDSMAARSMLYDLQQRKWSKKLAKIFGINIDRLLPINSSLNPSYLNPIKILDIPLLAMLGDQQASFLAYNQKPLLNMGTIASLIVSTNNKLKFAKGAVPGILFSEKINSKKKFSFIIEAISNSCGNLIEDLIKKYKLKNVQAIDQILKNKKINPQTVIFYAPNGTGTPDWKTQTKAIKINYSKKNLAANVRAELENVANFIIQNIEFFKKLKLISKHEKIMISGGLSENKYLADYIISQAKISIVKNEKIEASALGAAIAAMLANKASVMISKNHYRKVQALADGESNNRRKIWLGLRQRC